MLEKFNDLSFKDKTTVATANNGLNVQSIIIENVP